MNLAEEYTTMKASYLNLDLLGMHIHVVHDKYFGTALILPQSKCETPSYLEILLQDIHC